jgi:hypothetical protein
LSSRSITGIAMETIVVSSRIMKKPMHSAERAAHGLACLAIFGVLRDKVQVRTGSLIPNEWDSAGFEVGNQLVGPFELESPPRGRVSPVEPVDLGQLQFRAGS